MITPIWEQHCCLPLQLSANVGELVRYRNPGGAYLSVNIGFAPQSKADSATLAREFRGRLEWDDRLRPVGTVADIEGARAAGKVAVAFDLEDSNPIEGDIDNVGFFYELGVRSMLPTYNHANAAGCGCLDTEDTGLTEYGKALIREQHRVGMFTDGSHCSIKTGLDIAALASAAGVPMIYSHSNFKAKWDHPRNITDDQARACAETGGVIGINGVGIFLGYNEPGQRTERLAAMADHIEYGIELVGIEHVGVGSDYSFDDADFGNMLAANPEAFSDAYTKWGPLQWVPPEDFLSLQNVLHDRGFDDASIRAVVWENFARVAAQVWQ